jgi:predicted Na+-dependent transporter
VVSPTEQALLAVMIGVIMLGMGASLTFRDFVRAFKRPQAILIGFASQYGLMPLIGFLLGGAVGVTAAASDWADLDCGHARRFYLQYLHLLLAR